jgi:HD-like signal output (HDOD) protein
MDPEEARKTTGRDKLWKRWQASGLLAMSFVGYLGLTKPELKESTCQTCGIFHSLASLALFAAYQDSTVDFNQAFLQNPHLYIAVGFASIVFGIVE